jgi:hypothetical protein
MKHVNDFDADDQPSSPTDKANVAREVMGLSEGKQAGRAPKFHTMHIAAAENGSIIEHIKKSGVNPHGPDKTTKVVIPHDHPMHAHIAALNKHCEDCSS